MNGKDVKDSFRRVDVAVLLALVLQSVVLGFWGGKMTRGVEENSSAVSRLEAIHLVAPGGMTQ